MKGKTLLKQVGEGGKLRNDTGTVERILGASTVEVTT